MLPPCPRWGAGADNIICQYCRLMMPPDWQGERTLETFWKLLQITRVRLKAIVSTSRLHFKAWAQHLTWTSGTRHGPAGRRSPAPTVCPPPGTWQWWPATWPGGAAGSSPAGPGRPCTTCPRRATHSGWELTSPRDGSRPNQIKHFSSKFGFWNISIEPISSSLRAETQGGVNQFGEVTRASQGLLHYGDQVPPGFYGWGGYGGSLFLWSPQHRLGFAYVPSYLAWYDRGKQRAIKCLRKTVLDCLQ